MATTLFMNAQRSTVEGKADVAYDARTVQAGANAQGFHFWPTNGGDMIPGTGIGTASTNVPTPVTGSWDGKTYWWYSPRVSAPVTISSAISWHHQGRDFATMNPVHATFRAEVYKQTYGGSQIETLIGALTESAVGSGEARATYFTSSIPVPAPIALAAGERIVFKVFLVPVPGQTMVASSSSIVLPFGTLSPNSEMDLVFAETISFSANTTTLTLKNTTASGIAGYKDMIVANPNVVSVTYATTVTAGATEVPTTVSAGGAALAFISPRFAGPWIFDSPDPGVTAVQNAQVRSLESASTVNADIKMKLFRWRNGVETEIYSVTHGAELSTSAFPNALSSLTYQYSFTRTPFLADDRLVARFYAVPVSGQTMGAGTVSIQSEGQTTITYSRFNILDAPMAGFKLETDPATPATVPDGLTLLGLGN